MDELFGYPIVFTDKLPKLCEGDIVLGNFECFIEVEATCPECGTKCKGMLDAIRKLTHCLGCGAPIQIPEEVI